METGNTPQPAARRVNEIFSWEVYPRKLPKPPRINDRIRLRQIILAIIMMEFIVSASLFFIPFTPDYTSDTDVEGLFVDASGRPIPNARVSLDTGERTTTGEDGHFHMEDVQAGYRVFYFTHGSNGQTYETLVSRYHKNDIVVIQGEEQKTIPGAIEDWEHLNGLFFGSALLVLVFAMASLLALSLPRNASISFSACAMSLIASVLVIQTVWWMDIIALVLAVMSMLGLLRSYRLLVIERLRMLTRGAGLDPHQ